MVSNFASITATLIVDNPILRTMSFGNHHSRGGGIEPAQMPLDPLPAHIAQESFGNMPIFMPQTPPGPPQIQQHGPPPFTQYSGGPTMPVYTTPAALGINNSLDEQEPSTKRR